MGLGLLGNERGVGRRSEFRPRESAWRDALLALWGRGGESSRAGASRPLGSRVFLRSEWPTTDGEGSSGDPDFANRMAVADRRGRVGVEHDEVGAEPGGDPAAVLEVQGGGGVGRGDRDRLARESGRPPPSGRAHDAPRYRPHAAGWAPLSVPKPILTPASYSVLRLRRFIASEARAAAVLGSASTFVRQASSSTWRVSSGERAARANGVRVQGLVRPRRRWRRRG